MLGVQRGWLEANCYRHLLDKSRNLLYCGIRSIGYDRGNYPGSGGGGLGPLLGNIYRHEVDRSERKRAIMNSTLEAFLYIIAALIGIWILKVVVRFAIILMRALPRLLMLAGIILGSGWELYLLVTDPVMFALEFAVVAVVAYGLRRYYRNHGYSPLGALRRRVFGAVSDPSPIEELVEPVEVEPIPTPVAVGGAKIDILSWLDEALNGPEGAQADD
jgi:hypothetical protein